MAPIMLILTLLSVYYVGDYRVQMEYSKYPLRHREMVVEVAEQFGLEPWHVAAVIRCESGFWASAVSTAGARGLMQIMPDTGAWLAGKFNEHNIYNPDMLFDPETNVKYGCWYLSWLMDRYNGDRRVVTAAYHAGQGKVDSWLRNSKYSEDGVTLYYIPFESTADYVEDVMEACDKYQRLYDFDEGRNAA